MSTTDGNGDQEQRGHVVSVSEKGQATIPKELREKHGIHAPGKVRVRENDAGEIIVEPVASLTEFRGAADDTTKTGTELLRESREKDRERDRDLTERGE